MLNWLADVLVERQSRRAILKMVRGLLGSANDWTLHKGKLLPNGLATFDYKLDSKALAASICWRQDYSMFEGVGLREFTLVLGDTTTALPYHCWPALRRMVKRKQSRIERDAAQDELVDTETAIAKWVVGNEHRIRKAAFAAQQTAALNYHAALTKPVPKEL